MKMGVAILFLFLCSSMAVFLIESTAEAILLGNETDKLALLSFKKGIIKDPSGALNSWNDTIHFCDWDGVSCSTQQPQRVIILNLSNSGIEGSISPAIGNLSFLRSMLLMNNGLYGEIPGDFGRLHSLRVLNLSFNSIHGEIPANLSHCSELITIQLENNNLTGVIPAELGSTPKLKSLALDNNYLTGVIPPSLGNLSSLMEISLLYNSLQGSIPTELGNLVNLTFFQVAGNLFSGTIPSKLFNLSSLYYFSAAGNHLHGTLPQSIGSNLPNLQVLFLSINQFSGPIPTSLANISSLEALDLSQNNFSGKIPPEWGRLQNLVLLNVISNQLEASIEDGWQFLDSLTNCSQLQMLFIGVNKLGGTLPASIANLSTTMQKLEIGFNPITGTIPSGIQNLINLNILDAASCNLSGSIPEGIGKLANLQLFDLSSNHFTGKLPSSIGNQTQLNTLYLFDNEFLGQLPASLGNLQQLGIMDLSNNSFSGSIPKEVVSLPYISQYIDLSNNLLEGSLPSEIGTMKNLRQLSISGNKLSGEIPVALGQCEIMEELALDNNLLEGTIPQTISNMKGLQKLNLSHNNLSGVIPPSFSDLRVLQELDLSDNILSGSIPESIQNLNSLFYLNLSYNQLQGTVPVKGVFANSTAISLTGNERLCGGISQIHLNACPLVSTKKRKGWPLWLKIIIPIAGALLLSVILLAILALVHRKQRERKKTPELTSIEEERYPRLTYAELAKATEGFSSDNLIGSGRYGAVYKGSLDNGKIMVAVKVFKLQEIGASKSFLAECEALRCIRHRNLIKIITSCSSVDHQGRDFKALVFEYMPNGNLETWIHPEDDGHQQLKHLSLIQRLNIAINIADALDYLHHSCQPPMVHCDLKPSNVLLDKDMNAHVGDFGLAKFLWETMSQSLHDSNSTIGIQGTVGYVAPEYGAGSQVSTSGDVYSYGIILLEMFTGKRPTNDMFNEGLSIREFSRKGATSEHGMEISDGIIFLEVEGNANKNEIMRIKECLGSVLEVGLSCSNPSPRERMRINDAVAKLHVIRNEYLGAK